MICKFDDEISRVGSNCDKWDSIKNKYNNEDVIPLWVADMDFQVPFSVKSDIEKRLKHEIFGYTFLTDSYYESIISWMKRIHNWDVKKEWIKYTPGVVQGINYIIGAFTNPEDEVIVQTPVYHQFFKVIKNNECKIIENELINKDGKYYIDFDDLEQKITDRTKIILLCSPHNPIGRVWSKYELSKIGEIALKHNVLVVSDEIHSDLVFGENKHTVFSTISKDLEDISIICTSPNKTFNISGFNMANIIIPNSKLRDRFSNYLSKLCINEPTIFGSIALESVYTQGEGWYRDLTMYLESNINFAIEFINNRIDKLKVRKPEGTYLLWIDFSDINISCEKLNDRLVQEARILLNTGVMFGKKYGNYQRMNIATSRSILKEALERLENFVNSL